MSNYGISESSPYYDLLPTMTNNVSSRRGDSECPVTEAHEDWSDLGVDSVHLSLNNKCKQHSTLSIAIAMMRVGHSWR